MSNRIPRLRMQIAQSDDERPADSQVLYRQQMGWVILLGAFLALLCIPAFRYTFLNHSRAAWTYRMPAWAKYDEPHAKRLAKTLEAAKDQPQIQLGAIIAGGVNTQRPSADELYGRAAPTDETSRRDPRLSFYEGVAARFPEEPAVLAACLRSYAQRVIQVRRPELELAPEPGLIVRILEPRLLARVEKYVEQGRKLDPDNGFFPTLLAAAQMAARQDEKAIASLHTASRCSKWHDYAFLEGYGARDLLIRTYGDQGLSMHVAPLFSILLPHFVSVRQTARGVRAIAEREARSGNTAAEHAIRTDVIRLGSLMRASADTLIGRLVGTSIQEIGFRPWVVEKHHPHGTEERRQALLDEFAAYARKVNREAPHLSGEVESRLVSYRDHPAKAEADYFTHPSTRVLEAAQRREVAALTLLQQAGIALLLWGAAAVLAGAADFFSRMREPGAGRRWSEVSPVKRVLLLGTGVLPVLLSMLIGFPDPLPSVLLGIAVVLVIHRIARGSALPWSAGQVTLISLLGMGLATIGILSIGQPPSASWYNVSLLSTFLPADSNVTVKESWGLLFCPLPMALTLLVLIAGFARGASTASLFHGLRASAKTVSAVLVTAYLGLLLWTVPADRAATVAFDDLLAREIHGQMSTR